MFHVFPWKNEIFQKAEILVDIITTDLHNGCEFSASLIVVEKSDNTVNSKHID